MMAFMAVTTMNHEARSALPDAPVEPGPAAITPRKRARLQAWLARALHRAAWALEPAPPAAAETRQ